MTVTFRPRHVSHRNTCAFCFATESSESDESVLVVSGALLAARLPHPMTGQIALHACPPPEQRALGAVLPRRTDPDADFLGSDSEIALYISGAVTAFEFDAPGITFLEGEPVGFPTERTSASAAKRDIFSL